MYNKILFNSVIVNNLIYAIAGVIIGLAFSVIYYKLFVYRITNFSFAKEPEKENLAVELVIGGFFVMICLLMGIIIGMRD